LIGTVACGVARGERAQAASAASSLVNDSSQPSVSDEPLPPEILLDDYPPDIQAVANALRAVVTTAVPDAIERVRIGWRLIGYDVPAGRRTRYFAFVVPEPAHVHLGFEYGILMSDPQRLLHGAELKLRRVRYFTFEPGDPIPEGVVAGYVEEAAGLAILRA
jgi:hypothetical protein